MHETKVFTRVEGTQEFFTVGGTAPIRLDMKVFNSLHIPPTCNHLQGVFTKKENNASLGCLADNPFVFEDFPSALPHGYSYFHILYW